MKFAIGLTSSELSILMLSAAKSDIRYYLNGLNVEVGPDGGRVVSTDGHRLMVCAVDPQCCAGAGSAILPATFVLDLIRSTKGRRVFWTHRHLIQCDGLTLTAHDPKSKTDGVFTAQVIAGRFPDWRRVVPGKPTGERTYANPRTGDDGQTDYRGEYLADFDRAAELLTESGKGCASLTPNGKSGALVSIGDDTRFIGVLMPRVNDAGPEVAPSWVHADVTGTEVKAAA